MSSIFTKIVQGEIPSYRIYEDEDHLAFLDINPMQPGHTLVIPKREVDYLFDLSEAEYTGLWKAVRTVEAALKMALGCKRLVVLVVGYEVPHVHVHLIPTDELSDYPLPPRQTLEAADAEALTAKVVARLPESEPPPSRDDIPG